MNDMHFIGIDPGLTGGLVVLKPDDTLDLYEIPQLVKGVVDYEALANIFKEIAKKPHFVLMEDVHAIPGAGAMQSFNFGQIVGAKRAFLQAFGLKHIMVTPKTWQKTAWEGVPIVKKANGKNDTKAMSFIAATRLFPNQKFLKSKDGLIDGALIAFHGKTTYGK